MLLLNRTKKKVPDSMGFKYIINRTTQKLNSICILIKKEKIMSISLKMFYMLMFECVLPSALYFMIYALLISLIQNCILTLIIGGATFIPVFYVGIKIIKKLAERVERRL